jgi:rRNA maturation RNase YbeY
LNGALCIRNRQRAVFLNPRQFRQLCRWLLHQLLDESEFDLGIYLVPAAEMARLNEAFLGHKGSTDVITFDYADNAGQEPSLPSRAVLRRNFQIGRPDLLVGLDARRSGPAGPGFSSGKHPRKSPPRRRNGQAGARQGRPALFGEIFICPDEALIQARRFRTSWQSELARYLIHGVLHLRGFDDRRPADRRRMKREEDRLLSQLSHACPLSQLTGKRRSRRRSSIFHRKS